MRTSSKLVLSITLLTSLAPACSSARSDEGSAGSVESANLACPMPGPQTTITLTKAGLGAGMISSNPAGVSCAPPCSATVTGSSITLTPTPSIGSRFAGWGAGPCLTSGTSPCTLPLTGIGVTPLALFTRNADGSQSFDDVPPWHPFFTHVNLLQQWYVTAGTSVSPPLFGPDVPVTRGQMAVFIVRARNLALPDPTRGLRGGSPDNFDAPETPYFPVDVPSTHVYFKWIQKLRELGITQGYGDGRYGPDDPIPAGQAAVFVTRARFGENFTVQTPTYFSDVDANHPFYRYVEKMAEDHIECGCSWGSYCVGETVTRGKMAALVTRRFFGAPTCW